MLARKRWTHYLIALFVVGGWVAACESADEEEEVVCVIRVIDDNGVMRLTDSTTVGEEQRRCAWRVHVTDSVGPDPTMMRYDSVGPDPTE
jgi:hypothetical protein